MRSFVLLPARIAQTIATLRTGHVPNETGGFLIGIRRGPHIEVTGLTEQGSEDVARRTSFERRCRSHRDRIHAAWRTSDHFESLVGDWHSHPHGPGKASWTDGIAWRTLARAARQPIIGVVAADEVVPRLFLTVPGRNPVGRELAIVETGEDALIYGL